MNGWCSMIIWYVSYVANMYLWVFHGIPFLSFVAFGVELHGLTTSFEADLLERMRNGIGTLKVTATGATNGFLVIPREKTSEKTSASHLTWCRPLSFKRRSWRRHFQSRVSQQLQLVHLANPCQWNAAILLRSRKSLKATTPGNGSVTDLLDFLPKLISCLSKFS